MNFEAGAPAAKPFPNLYGSRKVIDESRMIFAYNLGLRKIELTIMILNLDS
ncbi:MAG: hypothetical protein ABII96_05940 [Candidatus Zixiibacteriota bacterium]